VLGCGDMRLRRAKLVLGEGPAGTPGSGGGARGERKRGGGGRSEGDAVVEKVRSPTAM
jgi:hypothetical protein